MRGERGEKLNIKKTMMQNSTNRPIESELAFDMVLNFSAPPRETFQI
jgi:hypothetical protein